MRCADARSAQIGGPDGISQVFQVSAYSGEPVPASAARNLLASDDWRAALGDEPEKSGPEVPLVENARSAACAGEGLTRAGPGPDRRVIRPTGEGERLLPPAEPGEEVDPPSPGKVAWSHVEDAPAVDVGVGVEGPEPGGGVGVVVVEVDIPHAVPSRAGSGAAVPFFAGFA